MFLFYLELWILFAHSTAASLAGALHRVHLDIFVVVVDVVRDFSCSCSCRWFDDDGWTRACCLVWSFPICQTLVMCRRLSRCGLTHKRLVGVNECLWNSHSSRREHKEWRQCFTGVTFRFVGQRNYRGKKDSLCGWRIVFHSKRLWYGSLFVLAVVLSSFSMFVRVEFQKLSG